MSARGETLRRRLDYSPSPTRKLPSHRLPGRLKAPGTNSPWLKLKAYSKPKRKKNLVGAAGAVKPPDESSRNRCRERACCR